MMMIILLYSRRRQMTAPASITSLYLTTKDRPDCGTPLISMPHPWVIYRCPNAFLINVQHGPPDSTFWMLYCYCHSWRCTDCSDPVGKIPVVDTPAWEAEKNAREREMEWGTEKESGLGEKTREFVASKYTPYCTALGIMRAKLLIKGWTLEQ